jgi:hypothetical protein
MKKKKLKKIIKSFEKKLEKKDGLVTEAVQDVILISVMNGAKEAEELIRSQFVIINKQDLK